MDPNLKFIEAHVVPCKQANTVAIYSTYMLIIYTGQFMTKGMDIDTQKEMLIS